jgi:S-formylglutathione hydrolase FrmB
LLINGFIGPTLSRITRLADISVIDWPFRLLLFGVSVLVVAGLFMIARRRVTRIIALAVGIVLLLLNVGFAVNANYAVFRTMGELFGADPDAASIDALRDDTVPSEGRVVTLTIVGSASGFPGRDARVYVPPAWFAKPRPALPVIMLLHGTPGGPEVWTEGGQAQLTADRFAAEHGGTAPLIVMPDANGSLTADTECVDSPVGRAETYLTVDVPSAVQREFGTAPPGKQWAVAGLSEGGSCALMLALRHPDLFSVFGNYGGLAGPRLGDTNADTASTIAQLFGGSQEAFAAHEPASLLATRKYPGMGGWFEVGTADAEPLAAARQLVPLAQQAGIATCLVLVDGGGHDFGVFARAFTDSLPWISARLGLVPPTPQMTAGCDPAPAP